MTPQDCLYRGWNMRKTCRKVHTEFINHQVSKKKTMKILWKQFFAGISKSYSSSIQRAVSRSIIKELNEQQFSFESDISNTCDFIAWNARKLSGKKFSILKQKV